MEILNILCNSELEYAIKNKQKREYAINKQKVKQTNKQLHTTIQEANIKQHIQ